MFLGSVQFSSGSLNLNWTSNFADHWTWTWTELKIYEPELNLNLKFGSVQVQFKVHEHVQVQYSIYKVDMPNLAHLSSTMNNTWYIDQNQMILVPFDSSHRDESNDTKITQIWSLNHKISHFNDYLKNIVQFWHSA